MYMHFTHELFAKFKEMERETEPGQFTTYTNRPILSGILSHTFLGFLVDLLKDFGTLF